MASLIWSLVEKYEEALPYTDPRTRNWVMVNNSPLFVWSLTVLYLIMVFLGPRVMKNRQAFDLSGFMVVYNLALVALSLYMFVEIGLSTWDAGYNYICAPYNQNTWKDPKELRVANVMWWYLISKGIELIDTALMVVRKKNNQITFLHWFHHASMLNIWWWVMMWIPGGQSFFGSALNCIVHVVMYAYYGLSAIPSLRGKLWFKNYITRFQLIQFCFSFSHAAYTLYSGCDFPPWGAHLLVWYMVLMLTLFSNFYIKTYMKTYHQKKLHQNGAKHENGAVANGHAANGHIGKTTKAD